MRRDRYSPLRRKLLLGSAAFAASSVASSVGSSSARSQIIYQNNVQPPYSKFKMQVRTALHETDQTWDIRVGFYRNVYCIKKSNTGTRSVEIHILDPGTSYRSFKRQTGTGLTQISPETANDWVFLVGNNEDIFALQRWNTRSGRVELRLISAASAYQQVSAPIVTSLPSAPANWSYCVDIYGSLWGIQTAGTSSGWTDVYVTTSGSGYNDRQYFPTILHQAPDGMFQFSVSPQLDLFCIKMNGTSSNTTEVHQLSWSTNLRSWALQVRTALHPVNGNQFAFSVTPDPDPKNVDVYCIKKYGTGSGGTEVHVLQRFIRERCFAINSTCPNTNPNTNTNPNKLEFEELPIEPSF